MAKCFDDVTKSTEIGPLLGQSPTLTIMQGLEINTSGTRLEREYIQCTWLLLRLSLLPYLVEFWLAVV